MLLNLVLSNIQRLQDKSKQAEKKKQAIQINEVYFALFILFRIEKLTQLPREIVEGAESLQVSGNRPFRSAQMPFLNSNVETDEVLRRNATNYVSIRLFH